MSEQAVTIGVVGAGTMGRGIAQIAAVNGHPVVLLDTDAGALESAVAALGRIFARLVEKGRMSDSEASAALARVRSETRSAALADAACVIEAASENLDVKRAIFREVEGAVSDDSLIATNTSSLPVGAISSACERPDRCVGAHFFNPAPLMPLVEVVPALTSGHDFTARARALFDGWGKVTVVAKDTPGFIVNRIARPFYGEALRIHEEGLADPATIDHAMKSLGGFRMGPFELMDLIGNDVNATVTQTVFEAFHFDPRYRPSFAQQRLVEAGRFGRKSGRGWYDHREGASRPDPSTDPLLLDAMFDRVLTMLINEAVDALFWDVASARDIDLAMTNGVSYPKGLLAWCDEIGADVVLDRMEALRGEYSEDRYRPSPLLRRAAREGQPLAVRASS